MSAARQISYRAPLLFIGAILMVAFGLVIWRLRTPTPAVPVPTAFDQLDPQLQAHLKDLIVQARRDARNPDRHATLGLACAANGLWTDARRCFANARRLRPREPLAWMYEAVATQELGDLPAAKAQYHELVRRFPDFPQGHYRLADVSLRLGDFAAASKGFARLVELAPDEWRGPAGLGEVHLRQRQPADAILQLQRAVQLAPREKIPRFLLGQALRDSGRLDDARRELAAGQGAIHLPMPDPWSAHAHEHMKLLPDILQMTAEYAERGQPDLAAAILQQSFLHHPDNLTLRTRLAEAWTRSGRAEEARRLLLDSLNRDPRNTATLVALSFACAQLGNHEEALLNADKAAALAPRSIEPQLARANALLGQEKDAEALEALRQAASIDPRNPQVHLESGDICWRNLGRTNDALNHYRQAATIDPGFAAPFARIAELSLELKDLPTARSALAELKHLAPDDPLVPELSAELNPASRP